MNDDILIASHRAEKETSRLFKERRLEQWNETYFLARDKVRTNRLLQRQPVNIPIIRDSVQSWISKIDEQPQISFETRGREADDEDQEILVNEMWNYTSETEKLDQKDHLDKKINGYQGRSFKFWYFKEGAVHCDIIDPYDIDIDPRVNPFDLNSAFFFNHKHIYVPLRNILANPSYSNEAKGLLKGFLDTKTGLIKAKQAGEEEQMRRDRLMQLGATNYDDFVSSEVMIELNRNYRLMWNPKENRLERYLCVIALDDVVLAKKPMKQAIGIETLPFATWATDPDLNDFWSDGIADNVRTINKVVNIHFSQEVENRSLRGMGMYFYDSKKGTNKPVGFEPRPFGMYPIEGNPSEVIQQIRIESLADNNNSMEYLKNLVQSSVAQTPTERGVQEKAGTTLGEVQLSLQQSQNRQQVVAKQYRQSWLDSGRIWYELLNANASGAFTLRKKGGDGQTYEKTVFPTNWQNPKGYDVKIEVKADKEANNDMEFKKLQYIKSSYVDNPVAQRLARKKELELLGWSPQEIDEVIGAEVANAQAQEQVQQQQSMQQMLESQPTAV